VSSKPISLSPQRRNVGHSVVQLVEVLRYKPEGRGFFCRWFN